MLFTKLEVRTGKMLRKVFTAFRAVKTQGNIFPERTDYVWH